ncbi:hypothetical protein VNO78_32992 [Psophocarpus tetragonolobus]|uniref:Uncharacterized protein n=1 Tax=Psophocarpus tetragonolobus TaxID=3891 RepID=A0AAN9RPD9_PSOTE
MLGDLRVQGTRGGSIDLVSTINGVVLPLGGAHDGRVVVGGANNGGRGSNLGDNERGRCEKCDNSFGGNTWPRQETLALLKIHLDMNMTFKDASIRSPFWEEASM